MITLDAIVLPDDLIWTDEFAETAVVHDFVYGLTGALFVTEGIKLAGMRMTLTGSADSAWIERGDLKALHALQESNIKMQLTLHDARVFDVIFDYKKKGLNAKPIVDFNAPDDADEYQLIIPLIKL